MLSELAGSAKVRHRASKHGFRRTQNMLHGGGISSIRRRPFLCPEAVRQSKPALRIRDHKDAPQSLTLWGQIYPHFGVPPPTHLLRTDQHNW